MDISGRKWPSIYLVIFSILILNQSNGEEDVQADKNGNKINSKAKAGRAVDKRHTNTQRGGQRQMKEQIIKPRQLVEMDKLVVVEQPCQLVVDKIQHINQHTTTK